jgi:hypothetical protein
MKGVGPYLGASATAILWLLACGVPVPLSAKLVDGGPDSGIEDAGVDAGTDAGPPNANCQLDISPSSLDFGDVPPGATASTQSVTLANTGTDVCVLEGLNLSAGTDSAFTLLNGSVASQLLSPSKGGPDPSTLVVQVGFSPRAIGTFSGAMQFELVDPDGGALEERVPMSGTGSVVGSSCFVILPKDLSFGTVGVSNGQYCATGKRKLIAINGCPMTVTIESMNIVPADSPFVLSSPTVFPIVVSPDSTASIVFGFRENGAPGNHSATLLIQTDLREVPFSLTLYGTIPTPSTQTDSFTGEILTLDHQYPLNGNPVPSSIAVSLNDAPLPASDWSYDSVSNVVAVSDAVSFRLSDMLRISYWLSCD